MQNGQILKLKNVKILLTKTQISIWGIVKAEFV